MSRPSRHSRFRSIALVALLLADTAACAAMGLATIPATADDGPITVYYPTADRSAPVRRGPFTLDVAEAGVPVRGNGRLVVVSHGSGGTPWVHADLARTLVEAGYVVAMPQHRGDHVGDDSRAGPESWQTRPLEVSRAIDAVGRDTRFAPLLALERVGVYGFSAGGHTALTLAGGRWSPAGFMQHCERHLEEDFQTCVGLYTRLTGGPLDGLKKRLALAVIRHRFDDAAPRAHADPRVAAVVAAMPAAADFDMASLAAPRVPLALVTARHDRWLVPRFHGDRVLAACQPACEHLADLATAGHGAGLAPLPPGLTGLVGDMLNDPPGFDRGELPAVDRRIAAFFTRHLVQPQAAAPAPAP